jgi:hypothetical protein
VHKRWGCLMLTTVVTVATPTFGQTTIQPAQPIGNQSAASVPDLSGIWGRSFYPGFGPPPTGPGPVTNRRRALNGASSVHELIGDHTNPILKPHAAEFVKTQGELELRDGLAPNPRNQCWPGGVPFVLTNVGMQMLQQLRSGTGRSQIASTDRRRGLRVICHLARGFRPPRGRRNGKMGQGRSHSWHQGRVVWLSEKRRVISLSICSLRVRKRGPYEP